MKSGFRCSFWNFDGEQAVEEGAMIRRVMSRVSASLVLVLGSLGSGIALANTPAAVRPSLTTAIEKATYRIEPVRIAGTATIYAAANKAQDLSVSFTPSGVRLTSAVASGPSWGWGMELQSWSYGKRALPVRPASLAVLEGRIEYRRGILTEWYANGPAGVEQGFTLQRPPSSRRGGELVLRLALSGDLVPTLAREEGSLLLARAGGDRILRFGGLRAFDAAGRSLPARMELRDSELAFLVDDTAAVYPVTVDPLLSRETKLTPSDAAADDLFGFSVAISGETALVGSPGHDSSSGSAYAFVRSGGIWSQEQKLTAGDASAGDLFGRTVAIDGDTAVVGAPFGGDAGESSGSAYVLVRSGGVWSQQQKLTASDAAAVSSVGVSKDTAVIGSHTSGSVYVFVRNGGVWSEQQKITASDTAAHDLFGYSVAVAGDTAVFGAPFRNSVHTRSGSAYVFVRAGSVWSQQQELTASDAEGDDEFGLSVALSGDTVVVGSPVHNSASGAAYVFGRSGGVWSQQQELTASDAASGGSFGISVAVSGDSVVVGADASSRPSDPGSAYVFVSNGGVWREQQKLTASDAARGDVFGTSVAVSGDLAVVGAHLHDGVGPDSGSAYVYELGPLAKVWVGLKNSDAVGIRFDLQAKVYLNGSPIGSGQLDSVAGGSSGFNNAKLDSIPLTLTVPVAVSSGDVLRIDVLVRNACSGSGKNSGTARLWYNGQQIDSGPTRDAGSRFDAPIGGSNGEYFLRGNSVLSMTAGTSRVSVDAAAGAKCSAFVPFGTWSAPLAP
jgi:hypothetical protein